MYLEPGEEKTAALRIDREDLLIYDPEKGKLLPVGEYEILIGTDSRTIFHRAALRVTGKNLYVMDENTTLGEILENPAAAAFEAPDCQYP